MCSSGCFEAWRSDPRCQVFFGSGSFRAALSVVPVQIEDEDGTAFAEDLDRLAGVGALVEQVAAWLRIVVRNPFADGLPRGSMGSKEHE